MSIVAVLARKYSVNISSAWLNNSIKIYKKKYPLRQQKAIEFSTAHPIIECQSEHWPTSIVIYQKVANELTTTSVDADLIPASESVTRSIDSSLLNHQPQSQSRVGHSHHRSSNGVLCLCLSRRSIESRVELRRWHTYRLMQGCPQTFQFQAPPQWRRHLQSAGKPFIYTRFSLYIGI